MVDEANRARDVPGYHPDQRVMVRLDGFLTQKVICFEGEWATRADAIKYIANVAHGVHSGEPREAAHALLRKIRYAAHISMGLDPTLNQEIPSLNFNIEAFGDTDKPIATNRSAIDFVLLQLLSAASYLTSSPDVIRLEEIIRAEA